MGLEPPELVALRRALGRQLAALRQAAEIGQQQVARRTGYSRSSVAHAESGRQLLTRDFWTTADELVKADGALQAGYERVQAAKQEHERQSREAELVAARARAERFRHEGGRVLQFPRSLLIPLPSSDAVVAANQQEWCAVRSYLIRHRTQLAKQAVELYNPAWRLPHTPALVLPSWLPSCPMPIEAVTLEWVPHPPHPVITGHEAELRSVLPLCMPGHAFLQYTSAIRYLSPPSLFENRPSYRLLDVSWKPQGKLQFGLATFFDKLDVSEALSHEFAAAMMKDALPAWSQLPFRARLSQPFDLSLRMSSTGIATLTIRRNATDGSSTFFLLGRDPTKVVVSGGQYGVIPAGEFQPSCIAPACMQDDLDLWRNIVREYSEELLGQPEHDGSSGQPLDYECWPFYRAMQRARESGHLRAYVLGVVLHALGLNSAIMTAVIIDDVVFDDLFRNLVNLTAEGQVVTSLDSNQSMYGLPFMEATVRRFLDHEPLGGTSAACLALAWRHRESLA